MNAGTPSGIIAMDVKDFGMKWDNALGRILWHGMGQCHQW
jgi:hypothetical protein